MNNGSGPSRSSDRRINRNNQVPHSPFGTANPIQSPRPSSRHVPNSHPIQFPRPSSRNHQVPNSHPIQFPRPSNLHHNTSANLNQEPLNFNQRFNRNVPRRFPTPPPGTINPLQLHSSTYVNPRGGPFSISRVLPAPLPPPSPLTLSGPETIPTHGLFSMRAQRANYSDDNVQYWDSELQYVESAIQALVALRQCGEKFSDNFVTLATAVGMTGEVARWNGEYLNQQEMQHRWWREVVKGIIIEISTWGRGGDNEGGPSAAEEGQAAEKDETANGQGTGLEKEKEGDSGTGNRESDETRSDKISSVGV